MGDSPIPEPGTAPTPPTHNPPPPGYPPLPGDPPPSGPVPALGTDLRNGYIANGRGGRMTVAEWEKYKKRKHERIAAYQKEQGK